MKIPEPRPVSFRDLVPEIPSTTYATHGILYYPARMIPHVARWAVERLSRPGDWVLDPFAGSGTVCVESSITGRNSACLDLNPVVEPLLEAKTYRPPGWGEVREAGLRVLEGGEPFKPRWSRMAYWYHPRILAVLKRMWGAYHEDPHPLVFAALASTSRKFSLADDSLNKLIRTRRKEEYIARILSAHPEAAVKRFFWRKLREAYGAAEEFARLARGGKVVARGGIDILEADISRLTGVDRFDLLVTSPPYGIAHEYIRTFKPLLAWLGLGDEEIRELSRREIPYRRPPLLEVESQTYRDYLPRIPPRLRPVYEAYFKSVLAALERALRAVAPGGAAALFLGNATFGGVEVPFHAVFAEHLSRRGWRPEALYADEIKRRKLFRGRRNVSPQGIRFEYLLVLRRV